MAMGEDSIRDHCRPFSKADRSCLVPIFQLEPLNCRASVAPTGDQALKIRLDGHTHPGSTIHLSWTHSVHLAERRCRREARPQRFSAVWALLRGAGAPGGAAKGWTGAQGGQHLAALGPRRHFQRTFAPRTSRRTDFPAADRDLARHPISVLIRLPEPGRLGRAAMRAAARGARRPSRTSATGRWAWLWRPPRRASPPSAGWSAGVRLAHRARAWSGAAAPPRRTAASRGRAGPGATSMRTATRTRDDSAS